MPTDTEKETKWTAKSDSQFISTRQRAAIEKLREQNNSLKEELLMENKFSVAPTNHNINVAINRCQDQLDLYTKKIEVEMRRLTELTFTGDKITTRIKTSRKKSGGVNAAQEQNWAVQKQIKLLENRLEKCNHKYNEALTKNNDLREHINNLRRERLVYDSIYKKLEKDLQEKKKDMANIIDICNTAYEARDAAINEMAQLKAHADKEQAAREAEWRDLGAIIDADRKAKEAARLQEKANLEMNAVATLDKEATTKKKFLKKNWNVAKDKVSQNVSMEKVQEYGKAFEKIQTATGIQDIDELVTSFVNAEDKNFTLFNYINELNQEIDKLEDQISTIRGEIETYKAGGMVSDTLRKKELKDMEEKLQKMEMKADLYEKKHEEAMKTVTTLKAGVWNMFNKIGCNTPGVRDMLGDGNVTENNLMQYLGIIEQRTNELLQTYAIVEQAANHQVTTVAGQTVKNMNSTATMKLFDPPTTNEEDPDSDEEQTPDDEKPLNREALTSKAQKSIAKKGESGRFRASNKPAGKK